MPNRRNRKPSPILIRGDLAEIFLSGRVANGRVAIIDASDIHLVQGYRWHASKTGNTVYASARMYEKIHALHRVVMNAATGEQIDHRDHDGLNCRRGNLRLCSHSQNNMNKPKPKHGLSSQFKGVAWDASKKRWASYIKLNRKTRNLGCFHWQLEAAMAYDRAAVKLFGEFALLNFKIDDQRTA